MAEKEWDLKEIKRIKKKNLVKSNLVLVVIFASLNFLFESGVSHTVIFGMLCLLLWLATVIIAYTYKTGKVIGTKDSQLDYDFEKWRLGEKRAKKRAVIGLVIFILFSIGATIAFFMVDFEQRNMDPSSDLFMLFAALLGLNLAQVNRIRKLKEYTK